MGGHLGKKSQSKDGELGDDVFGEDLELDETNNPELAVKPVYVKDDFFDSLSSGTFGRGGTNGRGRFSERRRVDTEALVNFQGIVSPIVVVDVVIAVVVAPVVRTIVAEVRLRKHGTSRPGGQGNSYPHRGSYGRD
ncbi:hypothetical protein ACP4OV_020775 [Aristida adscensionis]